MSWSRAHLARRARPRPLTPEYNCKHNPRGIVSLGVAENFLLEKECLEYFTQAFQRNFLASDLSYGDGLWGSRRINRALAGFLNE